MSAENCGNSITVLCVINPKITQKNLKGLPFAALSRGWRSSKVATGYEDWEKDKMKMIES